MEGPEIETSGTFGRVLGPDDYKKNPLKLGVISILSGGPIDPLIVGQPTGATTHVADTGADTK